MQDSEQDFEFSELIPSELYNKWFTLSGKSPFKPYDKEQVDDLFNAIKSQIGFFIKYLIQQDSSVYRTALPFFYINAEQMKVNCFEIEIAVVDNIIDCVNIPGCIVEGVSKEEAFDNLIRAVVQCSDARIKNGL